MGKFVDLTGQRFGKLTVIERKGESKCGHAAWLCRCDCGNQSVVIGRDLKRGCTTSCGCLKKECSGVYYRKATFKEIF